MLARLREFQRHMARQLGEIERLGVAEVDPGGERVVLAENIGAVGGEMTGLELHGWSSLVV